MRCVFSSPRDTEGQKRQASARELRVDNIMCTVCGYPQHLRLTVHVMSLISQKAKQILNFSSPRSVISHVYTNPRLSLFPLEIAKGRLDKLCLPLEHHSILFFFLVKDEISIGDTRRLVGARSGNEPSDEYGSTKNSLTSSPWPRETPPVLVPEPRLPPHHHCCSGV